MGQSLNRNGSRNVTVDFGATAKAYTTGQVVGAPVKVPSAVMDGGNTGTLLSMVLYDQENKKIAVDVYFFSKLPTTQGADGAAFALSIAENLNVLGRVSVAAGDYTTTGTGAEATKGNLWMHVAALQGSQASVPGQGSKDIYVLAVARGALTFAGAGKLLVRVGIEQD